MAPRVRAVRSHAWPPARRHHALKAGLALKDAALSRIDEPSGKTILFEPPDRLLAFLEAL